MSLYRLRGTHIASRVKLARRGKVFHPQGSSNRTICPAGWPQVFD